MKIYCTTYSEYDPSVSDFPSFRDAAIVTGHQPHYAVDACFRERVYVHIPWDDLRHAYTVDPAETAKLELFLRNLDTSRELAIVDDVSGPRCLALEAAVTTYFGLEDSWLWIFPPRPDADLYLALCAALGIRVTGKDIQAKEQFRRVITARIDQRRKKRAERQRLRKLGEQRREEGYDDGS